MSRAGLIFMGTGLTLWELRNHCVADNEALDLEMEEPPKPPKRCCSNSCLFTLAKEVPGDILDQNDLPEARDKEEEDEINCRFCEPTNSCRFCFAGPERGELIAPCDCPGSQVRPKPPPTLPSPLLEDNREKITPARTMKNDVGQNCEISLQCRPLGD